MEERERECKSDSEKVRERVKRRESKSGRERVCKSDSEKVRERVKSRELIRKI